MGWNQFLNENIYHHPHVIQDIYFFNFSSMYLCIYYLTYLTRNLEIWEWHFRIHFNPLCWRICRKIITGNICVQVFKLFIIQWMQWWIGFLHWKFKLVLSWKLVYRQKISHTTQKKKFELKFRRNFLVYNSIF